MATGLTLLLAAALSAPASTPEVHGVCDEGALADEEVRDEPPAAADCSEPPTPTVACSDLRMSFWVQEIGGTCAMPRDTVGAAPRPALPRPPIVCEGTGCSHDPPPLRAAHRGGDGSPSAI